jgi:predicted enzyme related to lactoylglutathione lyase
LSQQTLGDIMIGKLAWYDIPVLDMDRACKFYSEIFQIDIEQQGAGEYKMGIFQTEKASGALVSGPVLTPSKLGFLPYFSGGEDLNNILMRVEPAGGKVEVPKTSLGGHGFYAIFHDREGNRLGLHSSK